MYERFFFFFFLASSRYENEAVINAFGCFTDGRSIRKRDMFWQMLNSFRQPFFCINTLIFFFCNDMQTIFKCAKLASGSPEVTDYMQTITCYAKQLCGGKHGRSWCLLLFYLRKKQQQWLKIVLEEDEKWEKRGICIQYRTMRARLPVV